MIVAPQKSNLDCSMPSEGVVIGRCEARARSRIALTVNKTVNIQKNHEMIIVNLRI